MFLPVTRIIDAEIDSNVCIDNNDVYFTFFLILFPIKVPKKKSRNTEFSVQN